MRFLHAARYRPRFAEGNARTLRPAPETQRLIDELYREEVLEARAMCPADKNRAGQQLFDSAFRVTLPGIRNQNPGITEEQCREILRQRLVLKRKLEETS